MARIRPVLVVAMMFGLGAVVACSAVPQSEELQELESKLQDEEAQKLRDIPNAARYHDEAREYRRVAEDARHERRETHSRDYAILGLLRYQTAVAIYQQFEMVDELNEINAKIEEINPEVQEVTDRRNELAEELRELDDEIREAVREREEQRLADLEGDGTGIEAAGGGGGAQDAEVLERANEKIAEAEEMRSQALDYDADEYDETRGLFDRAETQLENAKTVLEESPGAAGTAKRQLGFAVQLFEEAHERAVPVHEEFVEKMRPENRIATLRDAAQANFGDQYTTQTTHGVEIVMPGLFVPSEPDFGHGMQSLMDALADLAAEYEEFSIEITGYTQRAGGTTENMALSQARAQKVANELSDQGVDDTRINHNGRGQQDIRFEDNPDNNDRVEVTLTHSDP